MAINLNSNISILAPFNLDAKYGVWSGADINTAKTNALNSIPSIYRAIGMTVGLFVGGNTTEYWFKSGTTNADLVEKTSGSTVSSGNLITVSGSGAINFTGGTNTGGNIVVRNSSGNNFGFQSSDGANGGLTIFGDLVGDSAVLTLLGTGASRFKMGDTDTLQFSSDSFISNGVFAYFQAEDYGNSNNFSFINYGKGTFGGDAVGFSAILQGVGTASGGESQVGAIGYDTDAKFVFRPNAIGGLGDFYSYMNSDGGNGLIFQYAGNNQAFLSSSNNLVLNGKILAGADDVVVEIPTGIIESRQSGNTSANLRLSGKTTGDQAILEFNPNASASGSYINNLNGQLHFRFQGVDIARFGANTTANFIVYNNMTVGNTNAPSNATLDVHQTGNTKANLRLTGISAGDNARLDFTPFAGSDGVINNSTNTKIFFWTNGSGTSYYDGGLFYFGSNRVQIDNTLSSNQSSLLIDPAYTSTGNSALTISGSSTQATTNGLNINLGLTGATSNSILVSSAISASSLLGRSVNISPSFTATANNDVLQSLYLNPTFASGAFTGVNSYSIFSNNGRTYYDAGIINSTTQPAHFFTWNASTGSGNIAQGVVINGTSTLSSTNDALLDVQSATSSIFLVRRTSVVFGTATINVPNGATIQPAGSQSVLNLSVTNGRRIVVSGDSTQNTAPAGGFKNFSHSHTASGTINSGSFTNLLLNDTFNFSSVTSGNPVARSIFINTAYTAGTGTVYRAIEVSTGDVFFGTTSGGLGVGASTTISDSAIFQVTSTTKGVLFPRMTTGQKTAITNVAGLVIYDTTLNKLCVNNGGGWETITSV